MKVNKIVTMYKHSNDINFFGVQKDNPYDATKKELYRVIVTYPNSKRRNSRAINYTWEHTIIPEENKFGSIPLGIS